jgi:hypothetical protein
MKKFIAFVFVLVSLLPGAATAQAFSVGIFNSNGVAVGSPVTFSGAQVLCNQSPFVEAPQISNPVEGYIEPDVTPAAATGCKVDLRALVATLPAATGYRAAVREVVNGVPGEWGPMSTAFAVEAQTTPHPCDGAAPTAGTIVEGTRTLSWCHDGKDANGAVITVTSWAVYVDNVRSLLSNIVAGTTTNAAGMRLYSAPVALTRGTRAVQLAGLNAVGESVKSATFTITVSAPPAVPTAPVIRGIGQ